MTQSVPARSTASPGSSPASVPTTPDELAADLRAVLGDTASFQVTNTSDSAPSWPSPALASGDTELPAPGGTGSGALVTGILTAAGVDGGSLAVAHESFGSGGMTYEADFVRSDGVEILMHVSNERDPKGDSSQLAAQPPLTLDQLSAIVTSDNW